jgi:hypothetical protein
VSQISRPEFLDAPGWRPLAEPVAHEAIAPQVLAHVKGCTIDVNGQAALGDSEVSD